MISLLEEVGEKLGEIAELIAERTGRVGVRELRVTYELGLRLGVTPGDPATLMTACGPVRVSADPKPVAVQRIAGVHVFERGPGRWTGPAAETCAVCGADPRNRVHAVAASIRGALLEQELRILTFQQDLSRPRIGSELRARMKGQLFEALVAFSEERRHEVRDVPRWEDDGGAPAPEALP